MIRTWTYILLAAIAALCIATQAKADDPVVAYNFYATESLSVALARANLDTAIADGDAAAITAAQKQLALAKANAAKATPFQLAVARNMPFVLLENTSTTADLTNFTLTLNDPTQTFAWAHVITSASAVIPDVVTPSGGPNQSVNLDFQNFLLAPGDHVVLQLNLDPIDPLGDKFADYREVFFHLDSSANTDENAMTKASFFDSATNTTADLPYFTWPNQDYPPGIGNPIYGLQFPSKPHGDHVMGFPTGDSMSQPVPEPGTLILAGLSALGLVIFQRQRRGRRSAI